MKPSDAWAAYGELLASAQTHKQVAARIGVSEASVRRYRAQVPPGTVVETAAPPTPAEETSAVSVEDKLRHQLSEMRAAHRKAAKLSVSQTRLLDAIEAAALTHGPISSPPPRSTGKGAGHPHELLLLASDWHAGAVVDPAQMHRLNAFNWEILRARVGNVRDGVFSHAKHVPNVQALTIGFLGDMVNGIIHEELVATNEFPVAEQAIMVGGLMAQFVADLASSFPRVHCVCVSGNHARTKPMHASANVFDSYDWISYHYAKALTSTLANVEWTIPKSGSALVEIAGGLNLMLEHGDGVRSTMVGFPAGGVARRNAAQRADMVDIGARIDHSAVGHFHVPQELNGGRVWVNGSLLGATEWTNKSGMERAPVVQMMPVFDADRGRYVGYRRIDGDR